jgi:hypothetical protein
MLMEHGQWPLLQRWEKRIAGVCGLKDSIPAVPQVLGPFLAKLKEQEVVKKYKISTEQACNGNQEGKVVDPERFVSDSTPDPDPTSKEGSAPTSDPGSDPATLVSASRELRGKLALYL